MSAGLPWSGTIAYVVIVTNHLVGKMIALVRGELKGTPGGHSHVQITIVLEVEIRSVVDFKFWRLVVMCIPLGMMLDLL